MNLEFSRTPASLYAILHYSDVIISAKASQITSLTIVYSTVYSSADQRKHQSSASLASVRGIHQWPVNSPHKGPVTRKMFPFDDVIVVCRSMAVDTVSVMHGIVPCMLHWQYISIQALWRSFVPNNAVIYNTAAPQTAYICCFNWENAVLDFQQTQNIIYYHHGGLSYPFN